MNLAATPAKLGSAKSKATEPSPAKYAQDASIHRHACTTIAFSAQIGIASRHRPLGVATCLVTVDDSASASASASTATAPRLEGGSSKSYVYSGDNTLVPILRGRASDADEREVGSVLGLQNTFNSYPFIA